MRLFRRAPASLPEKESCDRAVIARQWCLLAEKDRRVESLELELEATKATVSENVRVEALCQLVRVLRARAEFWRAQTKLAIELLEARKKLG